MMLAVSVSSSVFIIASTLYGMPISGNHTVVGALIGAGIAGIGSSAINWNYLTLIVTSWVLSPLLTTCLTFFLFTAVCYLTLGGRGINEDYPDDAFEQHGQKSKKLSLNAKLLWLTLICGCCVTLIFYMILFLVGANEIEAYAVHLMPVTFFLGVLLCRFIIYKCAIVQA